MRPKSRQTKSPRSAASRASSDYEPHRPVVKDVIPGPVDQHHDAAAEADHVDQVDTEPHQPSEKARKVHPAELRHRGVSADGRHDARVLVAKCASTAVPDHVGDRGGYMLASLHRHGDEHRQTRTAVRRDGEVADDEHDGMTWDLQRAVDLDPRLPHELNAG